MKRRPANRPSRFSFSSIKRALFAQPLKPLRSPFFRPFVESLEDRALPSGGSSLTFNAYPLQGTNVSTGVTVAMQLTWEEDCPPKDNQGSWLVSWQNQATGTALDAFASTITSQNGTAYSSFIFATPGTFEVPVYIRYVTTENGCVQETLDVTFNVTNKPAGASIPANTDCPTCGGKLANLVQAATGNTGNLPSGVSASLGSLLRWRGPTGLHRSLLQQLQSPLESNASPGLMAPAMQPVRATATAGSIRICRPCATSTATAALWRPLPTERPLTTSIRSTAAIRNASSAKTI